MEHEHTLLCKLCRNVFRLPEDCLAPRDKTARCPRCGSEEIMEAPPWAPLGSGQNIFENSVWEYECQQCLKTFNMTIPKSPSENKARRCPTCGGGPLYLLTDVGAQPLYCG